MILSIDCGIKNLAMCLICPVTKKIQEWDVSGVPPMHVDGVFPCMVRHLNSKTWTSGATTVVIEKQPDRNRKMKAVENLLHTYFLVREKDVVIWDARHKVPDVAGPGKARYAQRKKTSIERARKFIEDAPNQEWRAFFDKHSKKDDLADSLLQAISFIDKRPGPGAGPSEPAPPKKVVPRKPTENQTRTKYSRANLAYILKSNGKQDARFKKDLARYYSSIDELKTEFNIV